MKFYNTIPEEQETNINVDYFDKSLNIYSSRKSILKRLFEKLGEPNKLNYFKGTLTGASWKISFNDKKKLKNALSKTTLIGQMKNT